MIGYLLVRSIHYYGAFKEIDFFARFVGLGAGTGIPGKLALAPSAGASTGVPGNPPGPALAATPPAPLSGSSSSGIFVSFPLSYPVSPASRRRRSSRNAAASRNGNPVAGSRYFAAAPLTTHRGVSGVLGLGSFRGAGMGAPLRSSTRTTQTPEFLSLYDRARTAGANPSFFTTRSAFLSVAASALSSRSRSARLAISVAAASARISACVSWRGG